MIIYISGDIALDVHGHCPELTSSADNYEPGTTNSIIMDLIASRNWLPVINHSQFMLFCSKY